MLNLDLLVPQRYYEKGHTTPALIQLWPRILANYDARFLLCPSAVLQAQLLRIEERLFLEGPESVAQQLLSYTRNMQRATLRGDWPLEVGLTRLSSALEEKKKQQRFRRFPDVSLILSYCGEELKWMNSSFHRPLLPLVDLVVVAKCPSVSLESVPFRTLWRSVELLEVEDLPLRADECSAYLGYLYERYYALPRHMVFAPRPLNRAYMNEHMTSSLKKGLYRVYPYSSVLCYVAVLQDTITIHLRGGW